MNTRIYKLLEQAEMEEMSHGAFGEPESRTYTDIAKFAELLVNECLAIISSTQTLDTDENFRDGFNHAKKLCSQDIKKQFGV